MSRSSGTQTTTQTVQPADYVAPYLQGAAYEADALYRAGGPQVIGFSPQTQTALNWAEQRALGGSPTLQAAQNYTTQALSGQLNGQYPTTTNPYAYTGANNWAAQGSYNPFTQFGGNPFASGNFAENGFAYNAGQNPYASMLGGFADAQNPYLDATFNQAARATQNQLTSEFARAGRNLEAREPIRADQLNNLATSIYGGAYNADQNRALSAAQTLGGIGESALGRIYGATESNLGRLYDSLEANLGRQYGAYESDLNRLYGATQQNADQMFGGMESNLDRGLNAYQTDRAMQQQLVPFASGLASADYGDIGQLAGIGSQYEALQREYQNQSTNNLNTYLAQLLGMPGGTTTQSVPMERNWLAGAAGGGQLGSMFGPWGMLGGAILGGLYG